MGVAAGGQARSIRHVDTLTLAWDADLDAAMGLAGTVAHAEVMAHGGGRPNDLVGSLQGIDNSEAPLLRSRLFQAWVEKSFGSGGINLRVGLTDLNAEFDVADSTGLLIAPSFGIGPEFSGSGPAGPSIYPSTALAVRLAVRPTESLYGLVGIFNARAGVPGDPGGVDTSFDQGVMTAVETGWTGRGKVALGAWSYSGDRPDIRDTEAATGAPVGRRSQGLYGVVEAPIALGGRTVTPFLKSGISDGKTVEVASSWQAGVLIEPAFVSRPDSSFSAGIAQARLTGRARANGRDEGRDLAHSETQWELTYSDQIAPHVSVQPDLQLIRRPGADRAVKDALVVGLRIVAEY